MAKKRPIRLEDIWAFKVLGKIALSPDGTRVVFEMKRADPDENKNFTQLMVADVASGKVQPLTKADKHSDLLPRFSPDGSQLGFVSTREKKTRALWIMPMDGGEPRRVTDLSGDVHDFAFSPDGRRVAYTYQPITDREKLERDGKEEEVQKKPTFKHIKRLTHKLDGAGFWNGHYTHVYTLSLSGNAKPKQLTRGDFDDKEPRFSPDGKLVSFVSNRTENPDMLYDQSAVYVVNASGGTIRQITKGPGGYAGHSWSPDGRTIALIGMANKPGCWWQHDEHVHLVDAKGGTPRKLVRDIDNVHINHTLGDITITSFECMAPTWSADGSRVYFLVTEEGATHLYSRSVTRADTRREFDGKVNVMQIAYSPATEQFALSIGTATDPGDVFAWRAGETQPRRVSDVNGDLLKRIDVVEPEEFWIKSGNVKLQCWVMKPPGFRANRKYPAIVEIHGGPMAQYGYSMFHEMQWMAAKGYVVAYTNPRGSTGRGLEFRKCMFGDWGNLDHKDVKSLGDWVFSRPYVDKKRVGVTGGSYGGYMTNWIVGHESRYRAAVTQRSVVKWDSFFGTSDLGHVVVHEVSGVPWKPSPPMIKTAPFTYVDKIRTPLLIIHSEQDLRCPLEQGQQLFTALKYMGREVEFVCFEGESHGLSRGGRPQNRVERLRRIVGWFDKYMT